LPIWLVVLLIKTSWNHTRIVPHQERDAVQKLLCFLIQKQALFYRFKNWFLLKFKNVKRASNFALCSQKMKEKQWNFKLKVSALKSWRIGTKNSSVSSWIFWFFFHFRLDPCMVYIKTSMVEIFSAFHILKGRIWSSCSLEMIKRIKSYLKILSYLVLI
jgi:hypothetical protein